MLLYYITDRTQFPGDEHARRRTLLDKIVEAARAGVDYIQLREKDLSSVDLESLAREAVVQTEKLASFPSRGIGIRKPGHTTLDWTFGAHAARIRSILRRTGNRELRTRVLINSRTDIALAAGADGVHLRSEDVSPSDVRKIWNEASSRASRLAPRISIIAVSCHSASDVARAESEGVDFAVFAPVFEKNNAPAVQPRGISELREACATKIPVLALGGVTIENAASCLAAGAAGVAGIRLFQENRMEEVVRALRAL